jgi:hypothetical protein
MAGSTPFYGLAYFDFGDELDAPLNVQKEIDRFLVIDKQLYGLYNIFGSGVISGWEVEDNGFQQETGISIVVGPGIGIIRFITGETIFAEPVTGLPPNTILGIYAMLSGTSAIDRAVTFVWSETDLGGIAIQVAEVETGDNSVTSINNTVRTLIGFEQIIQEEIDAHKHRGTPTKIDLQDEVKNQLSGARLQNLDSAKIATGTFDIDRLPLIDHEDLEHDGLLTHAQLDSFVQTLSQNNKELLGEVASVNLLKQIIFLKYSYSDIDEHFVNELALIPGISPDSFIDFESSTSYINLIDNCISGVPPAVGEFIDIVWDNQTSLENTFSSTNVQILGGTITIERDEQARDTIEDFENAAGTGQDVPGFTKETQVVLDNLTVESEETDTLRAEGFYSGKFNPNRTFRALFTKTFDSARDWTNYDRLTVYVKTVAVSHGAVYAYFVHEKADGTEVNSSPFLLLAEDEVTDSTSIDNDFEQRVFDITGQTRTNVTKFVIFTDDVEENFNFYLDDIYVQNTSLFKEQGSVRYRYSSVSPIVFYSIFYDANTPTNTAVSVRVKTASSTSLLSRSSYSLSLSSGDVFALPGADAEIEIQFTTTDTSVTPSLDSLTLRLLVEAESNGFDIVSSSDWGRAEDTQNIDLLSSGGIQLNTPINVGGRYFSYLEAVREIDDDDIGIYGISGVNMPISPVQAIDWSDNALKRFDGPVSVVRQVSKNFVVADRDNDRIIEVDSNGALVKGFGSVHIEDTVLYPLVSTYNALTGILTLVTSKRIDKASVDLTKISVFVGTTEISLTAADVIQTTNKFDSILEILLSTNFQAQIAGTTDLFVNVIEGAFAEQLGSNATSQALMGLKGIECFVGDFTYIDNIRHPVYVNILDSENWVVANSTVLDSAAQPTNGTDPGIAVPSILEFDPDSPDEIVFSYSGINFSDFSLGGIEEYSDTRLAVAGVFSTTSTLNQVESEATETTLVSRMVYIEYRESNVLKDAESVILSSEDGTYGIKRNSTGTSEVAAGTTVQHVSVGRYEYVFNGVAGEAYTVAWKIVSNLGDTPIFSEQTVTVVGDDDAGTFRDRAEVALKTYRGIVAVVDKGTSAQAFQYTSPDGAFASDISIDSNGNLLVAESTFATNTGRVIILDSFGNIIWQKGRGEFGKINDAKSLSDGNVLISV